MRNYKSIVSRYYRIVNFFLNATLNKSAKILPCSTGYKEIIHAETKAHGVQLI